MKGHKWFAAVYDRMIAPAERGFMKHVRKDIAGGASGRVLEIGAGTGANFAYYQDGLEVVATEPDPYMMRRAEAKAGESKARIELKQASAAKLPFEDASFDTVVGTLVMCSVDDQAKALAEVRRVLKSDGEYRFFEHIRYENPIGALSQTLIEPLWGWVGAGCHPNRKTVDSIRDAGFEVTRVEVSLPTPPIPPMIFTRPHALGFATPRND
ncbi:MAG: class I SAM-dependent methyltransferase [Chloroflexi bacterium]|nr:class I SAM-dependent methyltransferase [Chloroflexota bacterium]